MAKTPPPEARDAAWHAIRFARTRLVEDGTLLPIFVGLGADPLITGGARIVAIPASWRNDRDKDLLVDAVRMVFALTRCDAYTFMCESWLTPPQQTTLEAMEEARRTGRYPGGVRPSERSDRIEVVSVTHERLDGWRHSVLAPIERGADGRPSGLGEPLLDASTHVDGPGGAVGRFSKLLPTEPLPPALYLEAKELLRSLAVSPDDDARWLQ